MEGFPRWQGVEAQIVGVMLTANGRLVLLHDYLQACMKVGDVFPLLELKAVERKALALLLAGLKEVDRTSIKALAILLASYRFRSTVALQVALAILVVMYSQWHRRAARKNRVRQRPAFDPLIMNSMALVVVDEDGKPIAMVEEEVLGNSSIALLEEGLSVQEKKRDEDEVVAPHSVVHEDRPLLLHLTKVQSGEATQVSSELLTQIDHSMATNGACDNHSQSDQVDAILGSIVLDSGMDFDLPIRVVFKEIVEKIRAKKSGLSDARKKKFELEKSDGDDREVTPDKDVENKKKKGKSPMKGTRSSTRLMARGQRPGAAAGIVIRDKKVIGGPSSSSFMENAFDETMEEAWMMEEVYFGSRDDGSGSSLPKFP
ncbi:uncharacterized protein LOC110007364 [Amborella trichopoda]|uniref:uncharacterized protein LOC110007364 n=1 Tax=Amborella trichopoda TaxID=13333 RepID=UPI0009BF3C9A|nr:uncharacterized protein LOC110007364 [Amborella trichopoda]|eukprot:XP_020523569.1 uncharacterized protein LOC110007364 [Amborella trichopoda]